MSLSPTAYSDAFIHDSPERASRIVGGRLLAGQELSQRLADYFRERAEVRKIQVGQLRDGF